MDISQALLGARKAIEDIQNKLDKIDREREKLLHQNDHFISIVSGYSNTVASIFKLPRGVKDEIIMYFVPDNHDLVRSHNFQARRDFVTLTHSAWVLHKTRKTIQDVQNRLDKLYRDQEELLHQKAFLNFTIIHYSNAMAPISKLPRDVICSIFQYFIQVPTVLMPTYSYGRMEENFNAQRDIITLTHVCSMWRQISFDTPRLWCAVCLRDANMRFVQLEDPGLFQVTNEWISRARSIPKLLCIRQLHRNTLRRNYGIIQKLFATHAFEKLWIYSDHVRELEPLWRIQPLEHVRDLYLAHNLCWLLLNANLKRLFIFGPWDIRDINTVVPWSQIRKLNFHHVPISVRCLSDILRQCSRLDDFQLVDPFVTPSPFVMDFAPLSNAQATFGKLQTLKLESWDARLIEFCMGWLTLPCVSDLQIKYREWCDEFECTTSVLTKLIHRSNGMPHLRHLAVSGTSLFIDIGIILQLLPSLESVNIAHGVISAAAMNDLATGRLGCHLCDFEAWAPGHDVDQVFKFLKLRYYNAVHGRSHRPRMTSFKRAKFTFAVKPGEDFTPIKLNIREALKFDDEKALKCFQWAEAFGHGLRGFF